jgi:poly(3-hydroxybutyrate) depolymerase
VLGEQWTGCRDGTTLAHYRIEGLGHAWPPLIDGHSAQELMWTFFQAHPLGNG